MENSFQSIPPDVFARELRALHDSIFSGRPPEDHPFRNQAWEMVLLESDISMYEEAFEALAYAAREVGDDELIIKDADIIWPQEPAVILPWSFAALDDVRCETVLGHVGVHMFGRSTFWGLACDEDDLSCVGGGPRFMDTFVAALGGREAVRERFLRFATLLCGMLHQSSERKP